VQTSAWPELFGSMYPPQHSNAPSRDRSTPSSPRRLSAGVSPLGSPRGVRRTNPTVPLTVPSPYSVAAAGSGPASSNHLHNNANTGHRSHANPQQTFAEHPFFSQEQQQQSEQSQAMLEQLAQQQLAQLRLHAQETAPVQQQPMPQYQQDPIQQSQAALILKQQQQLLDQLKQMQQLQLQQQQQQHQRQPQFGPPPQMQQQQLLLSQLIQQQQMQQLSQQKQLGLGNLGQPVANLLIPQLLQQQQQQQQLFNKMQHGAQSQQTPQSQAIMLRQLHQLLQQQEAQKFRPGPDVPRASEENTVLRTAPAPQEILSGAVSPMGLSRGSSFDDMHRSADSPALTPGRSSQATSSHHSPRAGYDSPYGIRTPSQAHSRRHSPTNRENRSGTATPLDAQSPHILDQWTPRGITEPITPPDESRSRGSRQSRSRESKSRSRSRDHSRSRDSRESRSRGESSSHSHERRPRHTDSPLLGPPQLAKLQQYAHQQARGSPNSFEHPSYDQDGSESDSISAGHPSQSPRSPRLGSFDPAATILDHASNQGSTRRRKAYVPELGAHARSMFTGGGKPSDQALSAADHTAATPTKMHGASARLAHAGFAHIMPECIVSPSNKSSLSASGREVKAEATKNLGASVQTWIERQNCNFGESYQIERQAALEREKAQEAQAKKERQLYAARMQHEELLHEFGGEQDAHARLLRKAAGATAEQHQRLVAATTVAKHTDKRVMQRHKEEMFRGGKSAE